MSTYEILSCEIYPAFDAYQLVGKYHIVVADWRNHICVDIAMVDTNGDIIETRLSQGVLEKLRPSLNKVQYKKLESILAHNNKVNNG